MFRQPPNENIRFDDAPCNLVQSNQHPNIRSCQLPNGNIYQRVTQYCEKSVEEVPRYNNEGILQMVICGGYIEKIIKGNLPTRDMPKILPLPFSFSKEQVNLHKKILVGRSLMAYPSLPLPLILQLPLVDTIQISPIAIRGQIRLEQEKTFIELTTATSFVSSLGSIPTTALAEISSQKVKNNIEILRLRLIGNTPSSVENNLDLMRERLTHSQTSLINTFVAKDRMVEEKIDNLKKRLLTDAFDSSILNEKSNETNKIVRDEKNINQVLTLPEGENSVDILITGEFSQRESTSQTNTSKKIEDLIFEETKRQISGVDEERLRQFIQEQLNKYPTPEARRGFLDSLPEEFKLRAKLYIPHQNSVGYKNVALPLVAYELALYITGLAAVAGKCYQDWRIRNAAFQVEQKNEMDLENKTNIFPGYEPGEFHDAKLGDKPTGFLPLFKNKKSNRYEKPLPDGSKMNTNKEEFPIQHIKQNPKGSDIEEDKKFLDTLFIYNEVKHMQTGKYKDLSKEAEVRDGFHHDHWPSAAAIIKAKENKIRKELSPEEKNQIIKNTNAIVITEELHFKSRTFGGKNTTQKIERDARDLAAAAARDAETFRRNALDAGYDVKEIDEAIKKMHELNRKSGLYAK